MSQPARCPTETDRPPNRLAGESSPYLLQHAHNPVDWYPWGDEAIEAARRRGVPIFLSIGYSTCYWCHVMERESFENESIAGIMNERFVCVKVDREERPELDEIYMAATVMMTGHGGWPMSVFLEPDQLRPFYCATYFPPEPRQRMPGFPQVLRGMSDAWRNRRDDVIAQAEQLAGAVREHLAGARGRTAAIGAEQVQQAAGVLLQIFDSTNGGFGGAPKFPQPVFLDLLMDVRERAGDDGTRTATDNAVRTTLDAMAIGGVYDQAGGGFHRYAVDATWTVPHFEKMLYDNAQLAETYARAARLYDDRFYRRVVRETLDYVLREMTLDADPGGALFSAQDAEVDHREGLNYLWTPEQMRDVLAPEDAELAIGAYGLESGPNFRDPHHPDEPPRNVLRLSARPAELAARFDLSREAFLERLDRIDAELLEARLRRKQPSTDDKILASWNGLMIAGLARGAALLDEPRFLDAAEHAAGFVLDEMRTEDAELIRSWRGGKPGPPGVLEDYAFLLYGLTTLGEVGAAMGRDAEAYLESARALYDTARPLFWDDRHAGFYDTRADRTDLFVRTRATHDGATPSGVSMMLRSLVALHELTAEPRYLDDAIATLESISTAIVEGPSNTANSVRALITLLAKPEAAKRVAQLGPTGEHPPDQPDAARPGPGFTPVEVYADAERIALAGDEPAEVNLVIRIKEGYHIVAADPGPGGQGLIPLRVHVINGTGIDAYADYPDGEPYGENDELRVHSGEVELRIAVERAGDWSGRPLLGVTYQACTETECMMPTTVELDVAIDAE